MIDFAKQAEEARRLLQVGQRGLAMVVAVRPTGESIDENPQAELDLSVALDGREPYKVTHRQVISRVAIGGVATGAKVPVRVDPSDAAKLLVAYPSAILPGRRERRPRAARGVHPVVLHGGPGR